MSRRGIRSTSWGLALVLLLAALPAVAGPPSGGPWSFWALVRAWLGWEGTVFSLGAEARPEPNKTGVNIDPNGQPHAAVPGDLPQTTAGSLAG